MYYVSLLAKEAEDAEALAASQASSAAVCRSQPFRNKRQVTVLTQEKHSPDKQESL